MSAGVHRRGRGAVALTVAFMLLGAACGSDDDESSDSTAAPSVASSTSATTATTSGGGGATTTAAAGSAGCPAFDTSIDEVQEGVGAQRFVSDIACADAAPLKAVGEPVIVGFQNAEGDPNGSFPEASLAAQAATEYINNELGGLGADIQNGTPGRPIKLEVCKMAISPDDSQRCANDLASKQPAIVISALNFFGNHFPIYAAADIPVLVGTPITIGDFTAPDVFSIGGGGGCVGQHLGLVYYATHQLNGRRIAVPWADTPPGVVCYYDLEAKPLDVLKGTVESDSPENGSMPELEYLGVPVKPATPDLTAQVTQVLDFNPDAIIYSAQGADCWNFVAALGRLGWTPEKIPLVLSGACVDYAAMTAAGDLALGVSFIGVGGAQLGDPATATNMRVKAEAINYQTKTLQYGLPKTESEKGFATAGWGVMLSLWEEASLVAVQGDEVTGQSIADAFKATDNSHKYAATPLSCSKAPSPYIAVCNADASVLEWDGTALVETVPRFTAIDLIGGTELKPGP